MSEFVRDAYGPEEAFNDALRHYGIKDGRASRTPAELTAAPQVVSSFRLSENTGMPVPQRKPVPKAERRKPVQNPQPAIVETAKQPVQEHIPEQKIRKAMTSRFREEGGLAVGLPSVPDQRPARKPVGMIDPSAGPDPNTNKIYRSADGKFDPKTIQVDRSSVDPSLPASPRRPTVKRTNTSGSNKSWAERRESFTNAVRRLSNTVKEASGIVMMDRHERRDYRRKRHSETGASFRDSHNSSSSPRSTSPITPIFDANATAGLHDHDNDAHAPPEKPLPGNLTKGERIAMGVSAAIDPIRRRRTNSSDMSFGMTDMAPPGMMSECENCFAPTWDYLIEGLCKECHKAKKMKAGKSKGK